MSRRPRPKIRKRGGLGRTNKRDLATEEEIAMDRGLQFR